MKITIFTLFPEMVEPFFKSSIMKRAVEKGLIQYNIINFRSYASGVHQKADDEPFGGGAGMVIMPEPLSKALDDSGAKGKRVVFPTPSGKQFTESYASDLSKEEELYFICGHYEGIDQRIIERDNISRESAEARIASQMSDDDLISRSNFVIENNSDLSSLEKRVNRIADLILNN